MRSGTRFNTKLEYLEPPISVATKEQMEDFVKNRSEIQARVGSGVRPPGSTVALR